MHSESYERVFKQVFWRKVGFLGSLFLLVAVAIKLAYAFASTRDWWVFFVMCTVVFNLLYFLYLFYRLLGTIHVDDQFVTYSNLFGEFRIRFCDITVIRANRPRQQITIRSPLGKIFAGSTYTKIDELIDLVTSNAEPFLEAKRAAMRQQPLRSHEFRYPKSFRLLTAGCALFFICVCVASVIAAITHAMSSQTAPDATTPTVFACLAVFYFCLFLVLIYGVWELQLRVVLEEHHVAWARWSQRGAIPYEAIQRITRRRDWDGDDIIELVYGGGRLKISHVMQDFDTLVARLREAVPVCWQGEEKVQFPVSVRVRWWSIPSRLLIVGLMLLIMAVYFGLKDMSKSEFTLANRGAFLLITFNACACLYGAAHHVVRGPRWVIFGRRSMVVRSGLGTRTYRTEAIENVYLREKSENAVVRRRLVLQIKGAPRLTLSESVISVPLVPLYELLCKEYWPEGYREPGVILNGIRRDARDK